MGGFSGPSYNQFISEAWGWPDEVTYGGFCNGSNVVVGTNPPYTATDFLSFYPKFGGTPLAVTGTFTANSPVVTGITTAGILPGQLVIGSGVPAGTVVSAVDGPGGNLTLSASFTGSSGVSTISVYNTPFVPLAVMNAYIALASASLVQARWKDGWIIGMADYIAHFCTLWMRSDGDAYSSPGQAAAAGLQRGITVSKSAGPVSMSIQTVAGLESWGSFNQTDYGVRFATTARAMGAGPMFIL